MKKLSRKEVSNLIFEALNEEKESDEMHSFGKTSVSTVVGKSLIGGIFNDFSGELGDHFYNKLIGKDSDLSQKKIVVMTIKSMFEILRKNFNNEIRKERLTGMIMSIINNVREKKESLFQNSLEDIFEIFKIYYENNLKSSTSNLKLLSPEALGAEGVTDNLNSDSKIINFFNVLGYFKKNPR